MIQLLAFYLFATVVIVSGLSTILARNPVHSVLWLILAFFNAAGLMVLVGAEFIAMLLVIVYVGAVAVLFLFVVMMLDVDFATLRAGFVKNAPLGLLIALVLVSELLLGTGAIHSGALVLGTADAATAAPQDLSNTAAIGALLYGRYLFLFETAGIILTVAMIGAIVLTHRKRGDVRGQNIAQQNARRPQDATVNLKPGVGQGVEL
jgi:NADH-quinone oxidoreductase subunit J